MSEKPGKLVRKAIMVARSLHDELRPAYADGGLAFSPADTAFRLNTKTKREAKIKAGKEDVGAPMNPRMTVRAPKGSGLPDFVTGHIKPSDWIKRTERVLSPNEITHASRWYENIEPNFGAYVKDPAERKKMMRAWLVAQQNISPAGAMNNVLMQKEQAQRGVPKHLWEAGGMPHPTEAARAVLADQPIKAGVGQKISDFVDSAEGKNSRSWYGDDPRGGKPFVVDVHTARDMGYVDQELKNHLTRLGYNKADIAKMQVDLNGSPTDAQYENAARRGNQLAAHLNKTGWHGRNDWEPRHAQAAGWMGMTKLTRNAEEDSESGLERNFRRISYEVSPGEGSPWAKKYGEALASLPVSEQRAITAQLGESAMGHASKMAGINLHSLVHGTGGWQTFQNPAVVGQGLMTQQAGDIGAHALGHLLNQTEVWHNRVKPVTTKPKGFAVDFTEPGGTKNLHDPDYLHDFFGKLMESDPHGLIQGYQPIMTAEGHPGIRALIDKGGTGTHQKLTEALQPGGGIDTMLRGLPFDVNSKIHEAEISKARNDWNEHPHGQAYISGLKQLTGRDPTAALAGARSQLEKELEGHLDKAHARQGTSWRTPQAAAPASGQVAPGLDKALAVANQARAPPAPPP